MTRAGTGEQEMEPGMYTGGVKSIHEHTAQVSSPSTEMKLKVILSGPRYRSKIKLLQLLIQSPNSIFPQTFQNLNPMIFRF